MWSSRRSLGLTQANHDWFLDRGAGRPVHARTVLPAVCDGFVSLGFSFVVAELHDWLRAYTDRDLHIPASRVWQSTPQRAIHLPDYGVNTA